jgi:hypothetical protein
MAGLHAGYRSAQRRQRAVLVILDERRQPAPGLGQLTHQRIAACGIAVDLLQDGARLRGVVVGAQRQLRRDNVVQPGQNRRPVRLDELAAVGEGSAGLLDSSGVEQQIRSDDGVHDAAEKAPTPSRLILLQSFCGVSSGAPRTDAACAHCHSRPRRRQIGGQLP